METIFLGAIAGFFLVAIFFLGRIQRVLTEIRDTLRQRP